MQTAHTYSATSIDDLIAVTQRIHTLYPKAAIVGIGISLGGYATVLITSIGVVLYYIILHHE